MAATDTICPMCGAKNPASAKRCTSCGARLDPLGPAELSAEEEARKQYQQEGFEWKWTFISFGIYFVMQAVILGFLPLLIATYDPQGLPGLLMSAAVWFVGGIIVGFVSPGKTFIEPAVGALIAVIPTVTWIMYISDVYRLSLIAYIIAGLLGVMITLFGAFLGERLQMGNRRQSRA